MKIAVIIIRVLMGLLFVFASVAYFFKLVPEPEQQGAMLAFSKGMEAAVYIMPVVKAIELLCGIAFLVGRFVPLATVVIFPIMFNILFVNIFLAPQGLIMAVLLFAFNLFLAYAYRKHYEGLFAAKGTISA